MHHMPGAWATIEPVRQAYLSAWDQMNLQRLASCMWPGSPAEFLAEIDAIAVAHIVDKVLAKAIFLVWIYPRYHGAARTSD